MHGPADKAAQDRRINENLSRIKRIIMVMSGKGGVGKSTVSTNLAFSLADAGHSVGIMDVDIHGPNIPKMLGIEGRTFSGTDESIEPVEIFPNFKAASIGLVGYNPNEALIWRGPLKIALIRQFIGDVVWGELDYLIIDTPPGTGDEVLTLAQTIPTAAGAVVVTTPQEVSILDSQKSLNFAKKLNVPILGIVENMSGFVCPNCGTITEIFKSGGGEKAAKESSVRFLGKLPLTPEIVLSGDSGHAFIASHPETPAAKAISSVIDGIKEEIAKNEEAGVYNKKLPETPEPKKAPEGFRPLQ
jgi:ATP-binding protein involved in chromosome partitioning